MQWTVAIGVDTHKDSHVAVALDRLGRRLGQCQVATTNAGYLELLHFAQALGRPAFALEGTGSYGAGLARVLSAAGCTVWEVERPRRRERRAKNDLIDAHRAASRLLSGEGLARLRGGGQAREDLRVLLLERRSGMRAQSAARNQLHALVVTAPEPLASRLRPLEGERLVAACLRLKPGGRESGVLVPVLRRLARRVRSLERELREVERELEAIVAALVPEIVAECGAGPLTAAQLVVSSGQPRRMKSEASFAALGGTSPVECSSGPKRRHRLNRGGDRQLNWALHVIARTRIRCHAETSAYYDRLLASGKSKREAMRCVKRQLARHFYRLLVANAALAGA
jgi:transposase